MLNVVDKLNLKDILNGDVYNIPMYQRNYAWGYDEILQLLQDIADFASEDNLHKENEHTKDEKSYYVGTLVVSQYDKNKYEVIDGQQRLTTITLIMLALLQKKESIKGDLSWYKTVNLNFEARENSNYTLQKIFNYSDKSSNNSFYEENKDNEAIWQGFFKCIKNNLENLLKEHGISIDQYTSCFLNKIKIIRIKVPYDTDLNHYFEIMNSRGQQLEQHEIVKAKLMAFLPNDTACRTFNKIWEACSSMHKYVQFNFAKEQSKKLFTDDGLGILRAKLSFDDLVDIINCNIGSCDIAGNESEKSFVDLFIEDNLKNKYSKPADNSSDEENETYRSIINFPNFLLQVLKVFIQSDHDLQQDNKYIVTLDDKTLLQTFQYVLELHQHKELFVKNFILNLLKIKTLFDLYIIKRHDERWSLNKPVRYNSKKNSNNDEIRYISSFTSNNEIAIIMAQSMFHVSSTSQIYKNWLFASLLYLSSLSAENCNIDASLYLKFFNDLAKAYMLDHYLAKEDKSLSFDKIIIAKGSKPTNSIDDIEWQNINIDIIDYKEDDVIPGEMIDNFVFNYYDYILWLDGAKVRSNFTFGYRNSVEHFYPQHPLEGNNELKANILQSFGNLCLVSSSINSKFSNNMPEAKLGNFGTDPEALKTYSLKLRNMFDLVKANIVKDNIPWSEETILKQEQEAKIKISESLKTKSEK